MDGKITAGVERDGMIKMGGMVRRGGERMKEKAAGEGREMKQ